MTGESPILGYTKLCVFNPDSKEMKKALPPFFGVDMTTRGEAQTWADTHGQNVEFRSDHRLRARHLPILAMDDKYAQSSIASQS